MKWLTTAYVAAWALYLIWVLVQHYRRFNARLRHCEQLYKSGNREEADLAKDQLFKDIRNDNI